MCTHSLFLCAREPGCAISLGVHDIALRLVNKGTTSRPEDCEMENRRHNVSGDIVILLLLLLLYRAYHLFLCISLSGYISYIFLIL